MNKTQLMVFFGVYMLVFLIHMNSLDGIYKLVNLILFGICSLLFLLIGLFYKDE